MYSHRTSCCTWKCAHTKQATAFENVLIQNQKDWKCTHTKSAMAFGNVLIQYKQQYLKMYSHRITHSIRKCTHTNQQKHWKCTCTKCAHTKLRRALKMYPYKTRHISNCNHTNQAIAFKMYSFKTSHQQHLDFQTNCPLVEICFELN